VRKAVAADLVAELSVYNPFDFFLEPSAERSPFVYEPSLAKDLAPFLELGPQSDALDEFVATIDRREQRTIDFLVGLNQRIAKVDQGIQHEQPLQRCLFIGQPSPCGKRSLGLLAGCRGFCS